ncbi:MAG: DUF4327 family protein [Prochloraceae cyanobacterium]|nr:DUF4327 family protein [Prochloraceae cyanobacterium]
MTTSIHYSIAIIREQARGLVEKGVLSHEQTIDSLFEYIPMIHWQEVEKELELNNFSFSDPLRDLLREKIG